MFLTQVSNLGLLHGRQSLYHLSHQGKPQTPSQEPLVVKTLPNTAGDGRGAVGTPGREDVLEEDMAVHAGALAWRAPWAEQPGGLHSTGCTGSGAPGAPSFRAGSLLSWYCFHRLYLGLGEN